jgi:hypothetical protein
MKMTLLYVKSTGQVMAAVTRAALPGTAQDSAGDPAAAAAEVAALAGDALQVRGFAQRGAAPVSSTRFAIPAGQLAALTVERDEEQLLSPRSYAVLDGKKPETFPRALLNVALDVRASSITATITEDLSEALPFVLQVMPVGGMEAGQRLEGTFQPHAHSVSLGLQRPLDGSYDILLLFRGYPPEVRNFHIGEANPQ